MSNYIKEQNEVIDWLKHPNELGKAPSKIEFVKEFTDPEGVNCKIFKYKTGMFSPWLLAIHSDSGIFSEQEKYDEATAVEKSQAMIDYLKQYWKSIALNEEEKKSRDKNAKPFMGFVLKAESKFEPGVFVDKFQKDWNEKLSATESEGEPKEGSDARIYSLDNGLSVVLGYMDMKIPNEEAEYHAKYNFGWPEAVAVANSHKAHVMVTVMGNGDRRSKAMLYAKAMVTLCSIENNIAVYANSIVYDPKMFENMRKLILQDQLPIPVLVWCNMGKEEEGVSAWTCGMEHFGLDELELVKCKREPSEIQGLMLILVNYCISNDITFRDGETVGLAADLQLKIEKSKGFNTNTEGETLKISFA